MSSKIVILGAGYAGILTAKKLARKFRKDQDVTITLIDKNPYHVMLTELHEVAAHRVDEESIRISLKKVFAGRRVNVVLDTITSMDFEGKKVRGEAGEYPYDYLVLAAGSQPTFFGIPGVKENAFTLWSYEDAIALRHHLEALFYQAAIEKDPAQRRKLLTFYIVGAGFTGVEMAGELAEYAPIMAEKFEIDPSEININIVDILDRTIPNLPEELSRKAERRLKKMGVNVILNTNVCRMGQGFLDVMQQGECVRKKTSTVIWGAGIESADIIGEAAKVLESEERNRIKTDSYLRSLDNESVYVIGDNMFFTPEGAECPVPQVVENCEHSSATAAHNLVVEITGKGSMKEYHPQFHGFMVCIGGRYGIARVGFPKAMINLPSFLAMFSKHLINIVYFIQVLGWNKVFSYMKHEFFTIRNRRSFVGGHFSNRTPSFLLAPLRVWLGAVWLYEGIQKVMEGWFNKPMLTGFFGGANAWYNQVLGLSGGAETVTAATEAATGGATEVAGTVLINWNLGLFRTLFVSGKALAESSLSDLAFRLDVPLMNWFVNNVVLSSESMQVVMQSGIVLTEILIGLALIGGLLTFPAAAVSLVLQFMFVCTTGLYLGTFWMIFAGVAVLIGAGRTFGLDYYVMPIWKKRWKKADIVRKLYIYHD